MNKEIDISIIIVNWNTEQLLRACLRSVFQSSKKIRYEVFVVDNDSKDGSVRMVRDEFPEARLIESKENLGFGRGNNLAIPQCTGEYILFLNPDTEIREDTLVRMTDFMRSHENAGAAGPRTVHEDGSVQISTAMFPRLWTIFTNNVSPRKALSAFSIFRKILKIEASHSSNGSEIEGDSHTKPVETLYGDFIIVRKSILDATGGFDPERFMYEEEVDLCYRIHQAGWEIWYVNEAEIIHHERQSIRQLPNHIKKEVDWFITGRAWFFGKHHGKLHVLCFYMFNWINSLIKLPLYGVLYFIQPGRRERCRERMVWDGLVLLWYPEQIFPKSKGRS